MTTVFEHLEAYAGDLVQGWSSGPDGSKAPFQIVQASGGPSPGTTTFSTLGLCTFPLPNGKSGSEARLIQHELIMIVPTDAIPPNIPGLLQQVGMEALSRKAAFLRGEVLGPKGALFEGYEPTALCASMPYCFPDNFSGVADPAIGNVAFVWIVPLLDEEVSVIRSSGWLAFEQKLQLQGEDFIFYRRSL